MIGLLPNSLNINEKERAIRTDFRVALIIFQAFNDVEYSDEEKIMVTLDSLYVDIEDIPPEDYEEAFKQALWFLDGGPIADSYKNKQQKKKSMDWEQDEQLLFSAINKVAGYETREKECLHWWTFLGFFFEIGEGLFSSVLNIRIKKSKGKKLETWEQEFYNENNEMIDLKTRYSKEEQDEIDYFNNLLK